MCTVLASQEPDARSAKSHEACKDDEEKLKKDEKSTLQSLQKLEELSQERWISPELSSANQALYLIQKMREMQRRELAMGRAVRCASELLHEPRIREEHHAKQKCNSALHRDGKWLRIKRIFVLGRHAYLEMKGQPSPSDFKWQGQGLQEKNESRWITQG